MAKVKLKINQKDLRDLQKDINKAIDTATEDTYEFYKKITPIRGGNARRNTRYKDNDRKAVITGDYAYAGRLDEGYSKQAPKGMNKPSLKELEKIIAKQFRRI